MLIKIVVVGKLKDRALQARCDEFFKWLTRDAKVEVVELPDSNPEKEARAILKTIEKDDGFFIALSEDGREFSSTAFAAELSRINRKIIFAIGGPFGLTPEVKQKADLLWSLSKLTFTHEIARLLLAEQLFRAINIIHGGKYHNE